MSVAELRPGGTLGLHVHSFEEGFYVLSGEAIVQINDTACRVASGDYGGSEASHV